MVEKTGRGGGGGGRGGGGGGGGGKGLGEREKERGGIEVELRIEGTFGSWEKGGWGEGPHRAMFGNEVTMRFPA